MTTSTTEALQSLSADIAIIGGSGLYQVQALTNKRSVTIQTPYGIPSDDIVLGELEGVTVAFLTRHGQGHKFVANVQHALRLSTPFSIIFIIQYSLYKKIRPRMALCFQ
ncbi:hypothetical protein [Psychrobacter sp. KCTC 72983]|uniref:hypothetical protein n=1 Tax=Psychrobacter sp. KCTC 72983 TaxID=2733866 RepID=UPI001E4FF00A|nr:hypothetical protein [Psychrobacter sp. KCTC 72983]